MGDKIQREEWDAFLFSGPVAPCALPSRRLKKEMPLEEEIAQRRKEISTDSYGMSIGEMISLYRDKELNIRPEFQRFFRWNLSQKSRFIESLLLGIPIPPIFVSQDDKGKWDVIDGLQRLSTILQLTGDLRDENDGAVAPLVLNKTRYLPSLHGKRWTTDPPLAPDELSESAKLLIKRARLDLKIVLNSSDKSSKFELFDRLNTGGSAATDQEVRNCILIMVNKPFFDWVSELGSIAEFKACLPLTERQYKEQFDMELVVRFLLLRIITTEELGNLIDIGPFLTSRIVEMAEDPGFNRAREEAAFRRTFGLLANALGEDSFRKYDHVKGKVTGPVLISGFEVMALGLGFYAHSADFNPTGEDIQTKHKQVWNNPAFINGTGSGIRAMSRLPITIPLGRQLFAP